MFREIFLNMLRLSTLLLLVSCISGCGYRIGGMGHPQLKSVAIAPVINDTLAYNAAANMRGQLAERFQVDGTMKLTGMSQADCIVYARITNIKLWEIDSSSSNDDDFLPNQWGVSLTVEFSVVIPGQAKPLIDKRKATGSAEFMSGPDIEISRNYAIKQACYSAAKDLVSQVTEAW
jgi:hypothetical protein